MIGLLVPGLQWAPAFALGAIVAPPDAVAATSVLRRLGVPRRVVTILEGESLVNDASALILLPGRGRGRPHRIVLRAGAGVSFFVVGIGGIAIGVVVGMADRPAHGDGRATRRSRSILSLIAPITAYLAAEAVGVSGVLATVTAGLIAGSRAPPGRCSPDGRFLGNGSGRSLYFLIDSFLFMLIGLQLPFVLPGLTGYSTRRARRARGARSASR